MNTNAEKAPMEFRKANAEEKLESLLELLDSPGLPPLLMQLELCIQAMEGDVLRFSVGPDTEGTLVQLKCRAEGARKLFSIFKSHIEKLKKNKEAVE